MGLLCLDNRFYQRLFAAWIEVSTGSVFKPIVTWLNQISNTGDVLATY